MKRLIYTCILSLALISASCDGGGDTGVPGEEYAGTPQTLNVTVSQVNMGEGRPTVFFKVTAEDGLNYSRLDLSQLRFTMAKLVTYTDGNASEWVNYINRTETVDADVWGPANSAVQATTENDGDLINLGGGEYYYTFTMNVYLVTEPKVVEFTPYDTHRVAIQLSGGDLPPANGIFDFVPAGGFPTDQRLIATGSSCNECHGELAMHGGGRKDIRYCVTCHNPGTVDANSGLNLDMKVMVHKLHRGANLPSVAAGGSYAIWGYRDSKHDYSSLHYPQDVRNCEKCHNDTLPATPDGGNWNTMPTQEVCSSCHDNIVFDGSTPAGWQMPHSGGTLSDNSGCATCHNPTNIVSKHEIPARTMVANFEYNLLSVSYAAGDVTVNFSITNPLTSTAYGLEANTAFTQDAPGGASRLNMLIGWSGNGVDYDHEGSTNITRGGAPEEVNVLTPANVTDNLDGTYTVVSTLPVVGGQDANSGVIALEGHPAGQDPKTGLWTVRVPVKSAFQTFPITATTAMTRRDAVDIAKCNNCHDSLSMHGSNRTDEIGVCVICHNARSTDINRRPADTSFPLTFTINEDAADLKFEETIDMKHMIHGIHGASKRAVPITVYGYGGTAHTFDTTQVHFPNKPNNCVACHVGDEYSVPLTTGVLDMSIGTLDSGAVDDPAIQTDDLLISATAAVCSACHNSNLATSHMQQNGGSFGVAVGIIGTDAATTETCGVCHGPGKLGDVRERHGF